MRPDVVNSRLAPAELEQPVGGTKLFNVTVGLTQDPDEIPRPEARDSVSPETYLELAKAADNHVPAAGVIPFVFDLVASAADVASIFERVVRRGGPMPQSKVVKERVLRDLGYVLRNIVKIAAFFGFSLRDVIDADAERLTPDEPDEA